jgi:hypothetical protein
MRGAHRGRVRQLRDRRYPLLVVQDGDTFRFVYVGEPEEEIADDLVYEGVIQPIEGSDHFEALAGICGGDYKAEEIVRLRRIDISEDVARFDADSIFFTDDFPSAKGFSISIPASGCMSGCRRSGPTCRSASDQAFARHDDEAMDKLVSWPGVPSLYGGLHCPRPRLPWAGYAPDPATPV